MEELYCNITHILLTEDNNFQHIVNEIAGELKDILGIKTKVVTVNDTKFVTNPFFTSTFEGLQISLDSFYIIGVDTNLGIIGISQLAHEFTHCYITEYHDEYKELQNQVLKKFRTQNKDSIQIEKIEELTCDIVAAHIFELSYPYSYILSYNPTFDFEAIDHFDDYFRIAQIMNFLGVNNKHINNFLSNYKNSSRDYKSYSTVMSDVTDIYKKFLSKKFIVSEKLKMQNKILLDSYEEIFSSKNAVNLQKIIEKYENVLINMV